MVGISATCTACNGAGVLHLPYTTSLIAAPKCARCDSTGQEPPTTAEAITQLTEMLAPLLVRIVTAIEYMAVRDDKEESVR